MRKWRAVLTSSRKNSPATLTSSSSSPRTPAGILFHLQGTPHVVFPPVQCKAPLCAWTLLGININSLLLLITFSRACYMPWTDLIFSKILSLFICPTIIKSNCYYKHTFYGWGNRWLGWYFNFFQISKLVKMHPGFQVWLTLENSSATRPAIFNQCAKMSKTCHTWLLSQGPWPLFPQAVK